MSRAELEARRTAAAAVLAGYDRALNEPAVQVWTYWGQRLATELRSLLEQLAAEKPGPLEQLGAEAAVRQLEQIRLVLDQVFGDELADRQFALEQIDDILRGDR